MLQIMFLYTEHNGTTSTYLFAAEDCCNAMQFGRQVSTFQRCQTNQTRWPHIPEENNLHCHYHHDHKSHLILITPDTVNLTKMYQQN